MKAIIKTAQEITAMRKSGKILAAILTELAAAAKPGISPADLEKMAAKLFEKYNVIPSFKGYHGYPAALCTSVNNEVVHTIPNTRPLKSGDLLKIDCGVTLGGMITDSAIALIIDEKNTAPDQKILHFRNTCIKALWAGIETVRPGARFGDLSHAIGKVIKAAGYTVVEELTGHGVGRALHEDPYIPNDGKPNTGEILKPGMIFALEPIMTIGGPHIRTLEDGWTIITEDGSLACQHEHTILVTETGHEVLTLRENEFTAASSAHTT